MRVFGPRTILEAAFVVAVPIVALAAGLSRLAIIAAAAVGYLFVVGIEATLARLSVAVDEAQPRPWPVPAPQPVPPRPEPVPLPEPEPDPELEPAAERDRSNVVPLGAPRRWSLWDLERLAREHAGSDAAVDDERTFLLLYLRDFADADGVLPADFDQLVRDSFGTLANR